MLAPAQLEEHRLALTGHCYRMMGSIMDADDALQETLVRAWRSAERFDGRASLRTWLYRIATNVCLDMLAERKQRFRGVDAGPAGTPELLESELVTLPSSHWLEPVPDALVLPATDDPAEQLMMKQSVRLAFVAALQHLPPKQRAALLLAEVLGWSVAEIAESLDASVPSINSALQRARATLSTRDLREGQGELSPAQARMVERYVDAFLRFDVDTLVGLLKDDSTLSMPPFTLWLQGPERVRTWLRGLGSGCRGSRLVPLQASGGTPAFAQYRPSPAGGFHAWAVLLVDVNDEAVTGMTSFLDVQTLFPKFGVPLVLG